jgi:hypothetical protein
MMLAYTFTWQMHTHAPETHVGMAFVIMRDVPWLQELRSIQNRDKHNVDLEEEMEVLQQGFEQQLRHRDHDIMQLRADNTSLTAQLKSANRQVTSSHCTPHMTLHI